MSFPSTQARASRSCALSGALAGRRLEAPSAVRADKGKQANLRVVAAGKNVLLVNTNGGGHAAIGFHLAKQMAGNGNTVTILTVGAEDDKKMSKEPFSRFQELRDLGVKTVWGSAAAVPADLGKFDVAIDNSGKDMESVQPYADWAKASGVQQFLFVSSAGIYKTTDETPHVEGDAVKSSAGHATVESYLGGLGLPLGFASFRPQYMTGDANNKDCEEWFFDRIVRGRPVPVPAPGIQLTNVAPVSDVASIIAAAVEKPEAAKNTIFNAVGDRAVTLDGMVRLCAVAAGKDPKDVAIVHYDPSAAGVDVKKAFPFRPVHFYAEPRAAKDKLAWAPSSSLADTLKARFAHYQAIGRDKKELAFPIDDQIIASL